MLGQLKQLVKSTGIAGKMSQVAGFLVPPQIVILRYHSVRHDPPLLDAYIPLDISHASDVFRMQMAYVARNCTPISLNDVPAYLQGRLPLPNRAVIITFDDGFRDNYEVAAPILEECGLRGVFYVPTSAVEGRPIWFVRLRYWSVKARKTRSEFLDASAHCASINELEREKFLATLEYANSVTDNLSMSWSQIRELSARGHIIGSHTKNHPNLARIDEVEATCEIKDSKAELEQHLGHPVTHFSYPNPILFPNWNQVTMRLCVEAGYATCATSDAGTINKNSNLMAFSRHYTAASFTDFCWNLELAFCGSKR